MNLNWKFAASVQKNLNIKKARTIVQAFLVTTVLLTTV
ncbi:hypothetical protein Bdt_1415 [Bdellovibrio bacteriovorus str. Tiberius]|uniref:Uncharacterized protein n=1 Tax=Bdellovibrio bacteriovorus str. Tiberius TaxID=1069642 RepID=K7YTZ9_BDEBC|nr:hypothetical protein Bdt_1415 [Bdellovibrio bacteriovorus str. Tiberius]